MSSKNPHLNQAISATTRARTDFEPFGALSENGDLDRLLQSSTVTARSAIAYHCSGQYAMRERVIGDDMFYFITQGTAEVHIEEQKYSLSAGDCAHFARGVRHAAFAVAGKKFAVTVLHYDAQVFGGLALPKLLDFSSIFHWGMDSDLAGMLKEMCRIYALQPAGWQPLFNAITTRFLWEIIDKSAPLQSSQISLSGRAGERLLPALTLMQEQLKNPLSIEQLAAKCHLSPAHFRRVFQEAMGVSPLRYLQQRRLEKACQLLLHGSDTIEAISIQVGYEDASYFSHTFRRVMGLSPGRYRKQNVL